MISIVDWTNVSACLWLWSATHLGDWDLGREISDRPGNHGNLPDYVRGVLGPEVYRRTLGVVRACLSTRR